jgi:iron complex outermembrane recepter protein
VTAVGYAAFGQVDWRIFAPLTLTAGLRVSRDEKDADYGASGNAPQLGAILETYRISIGRSWTSVDPLLSVRYDLFDATMAYATWASGFKAGAFQWLAFTEEIARQVVDPETVDNYEVGVKSTFLDQRLRVNVAAFWMDYSDLQQLRLADVAGAVARTVQANAAESTIRGVELEGSARVLDSLSADWSYAYLDARYDEYVFDETADFSGNRLPRAPEHAASLALNYSRSLPIAELAGRVAYAWRDSFFFESDNNEINQATDERALGLLDASLAVARGAWSLTFWGTNLTNAAYRTHILAWGANEALGETFAAPRTLGVRLAAEF